MASCEICGAETSSLVKAKVDSAIFSVCDKCKGHGEVITEPVKKMQPLFVPMRASDSDRVIVSDFAQIIRTARQRKGLKQEELANQLNEKISLIQSLETNRHKPDLKLARKLERFFGVDLIEELES